MSPRLLARIVLSSGLLAACAAVVPGAHAAPAPRGAARPAEPSPVTLALVEPVQADSLFHWDASVEVRNAGAAGYFVDTLTLAIEDLDPGQTRAERVQRPDVSTFLARDYALGGDDALTIAYSRVATAERARFTFELTAHANGEAPRTSRLVFETTPGPVWSASPSRTLTVDGHAVETVFVPAAGASGPAPGLLLVHGHASHARLMIPMALRLAARGYAVMLVSLPGYGTSDGPADLGGAASVRAAGAALDALAHAPGVDPRRLGAWGLSRGAGVVASLAASRADLRALVAQSGIYDLWAVHRGTTLPGFAATIVAEAGADSAAWRERSPLLRASSVHAATLVLHGERDANVPVAQAHAFAAALQAAGTAVESGFTPAGHLLPTAATERTALEFLDRVLRDGATR
jgi:dienelactone hydrolase